MKISNDRSVYLYHGQPVFMANTHQTGMVRLFELVPGPVGGLFCGHPVGMFELSTIGKYVTRAAHLDNEVA